jgi:hypothetical protein
MVSWPEGVLIAPEVTGTMMLAGGTVEPMDFTPDTASAEHASLLQRGYYLLTLELRDGAQTVWATVDTARIVAGGTSYWHYELVEDVNRGGVTIVPDLQDPIEITLVGAVEQLSQDESMTVTADTGDAAVDEYKWYLNGDEVATGETVTIGPGLEPGFHWLDVIVTAGPVLSSARVEFEVVGTTHEPPIDLSGYWDFYPTIPGEGEFYLGPLPLEQTGTDLLCAYGLSGHIIGAVFFLEGDFEEDEVITHGEMVGTACPTEITGDYTGLPFGDGTFRFVPSEAPFGHLDVAGTFQGEAVSLDTEYGLAWRDTDSYFEYSIGLSAGDLNGLRIGTEDHELSVRRFYVDQEEWLGADVNEMYGGQEATGGWIDITAYSETGMAGTFDLDFSDGELAGSFDVVFDVGGTTSVSGTWRGNPVSGDTSTAFASRNAWGSENITISYLDAHLELFLWINSDDPLQSGVHLSPDIRFAMTWLDDWAGERDEVDATSCEIHLDTLTEEAVEGWLTGSFADGGSVTANFAMDFAPEIGY